jgi:hypothetical protein
MEARESQMPSIDELLSLDNLKLPEKPRVERIECYEMVDSRDHDALRVTIVLDIDDPFEILRYRAERHSIEDQVFEILRRHGETRWPYFRYLRTADWAAEQAEA